MHEESSKSYHHGNLRQSLLEEAVRLLEREGAGQLSLRKVAAGAGVSHTAPYRHFRDKAEILAAVAEQGFQHLVDEMEAARVRFDDLEKSLLEIGVAYVLFAVHHAPHFSVMFREHPAEATEVHQAGEKAFRVMADVIAVGVKKGVFGEGGAESYAIAAWTMVHGQASLMLEGLLIKDKPGKMSVAAYADAIARDVIPILIRGMQKA